MKKRHGLGIMLLGAVVAVLGVYLLIVQRNQAADMAKAIVVKDAAGSDVASDVAELKAYAAAHMKVHVSYELAGSYQRAVQKAKEGQGSANSAMYKEAQASCDKRGVDSIRQASCVAQYLAAHGQGSSTPVVLPNEATFKYDIAGPNWSFDVAGLFLSFGGALMLVGVLLAAIRLVRPAQ